MYDIIIIGGGPAGLTAALYARRARKSVLVLEKNVFGGQITWSPRVENFPGHPSVSGVELADALLAQAMDQGAETDLAEVLSLRREGDVWAVGCDVGPERVARALILATGARPRPLGLEREEELVGSGVCYCAVCDGAFYAGETVAVCGGGSSALQDALFLSETCRKVYLVHRRAALRGESALAEALARRDNVELLLETQPLAFVGEESVTGLLVEQGGVRRELPVSGVFIAVGHRPDNAAFAPFLALDAEGFAASDEGCLTPTPGLFVAGDCRAKAVRQLTTAAADGAVAALAAAAYLDSR